MQHSNFQRPNQALSCGNRPPRSAFPSLPALSPLPQIVDPDSWLDALHGWHVERKVDAHGMVRIDLKAYYISRNLAGQRLTFQLDAKTPSLQVFQGPQKLKSVPIKGLVGHLLTFEQFLAHMRAQARAQARLRSLQERRLRTSALASPEMDLSVCLLVYEEGTQLGSRAGYSIQSCLIGVPLEAYTGTLSLLVIRRRRAIDSSGTFQRNDILLG